MKHRVLALVLALSVAACSASDIPLAKSTTGRDPTVAEVPGKEETVRGDGDPAIVTLDLNSSLHEHRLAVTDDLPGSLIIPTTNLQAVPVTAALQAVLSGTDVSLAWNTGALGSRLVTITNLSGPLPKVVAKICSAAKVFCDYRHGSLELTEKETFVVGLPPSPQATGSGGSSAGGAESSSMVLAINSLIGGSSDSSSNSKVQVDTQGGNIVYTTNVDGEERVSQYLQELRTGRPLIVLQMYLWEVTLSRENAQGINWSQLSNDTVSKSLHLTGSNALDSVASATGSVSLGAVTTGIISATSVASFLATKGQVQSISNPQITFVSGTAAHLKVGGTKRYISQVGTLTGTSNVSGTNASSNSNTNASTNTVTTDSIDTGLTINAAGSYENGIVFANLDILIKNLIGLNPTASGGGTIDLPETSDEQMTTILRVRPGDSLVLAGLVTSNDSGKSEGFPIGSDSAIPLYGDETHNNHELVMIVKPSIVLFSDKHAIENEKKQAAARPMPDAVIIDKDGPRVLSMPSSPYQPAQQPQAPTATRSPELLVPSMSPEPTLNMILEPIEGHHSVDQNTMQGGFSHALDQILPPAGDTAMNGGVP